MAKAGNRREAHKQARVKAKGKRREAHTASRAARKGGK